MTTTSTTTAETAPVIEAPEVTVTGPIAGTPQTSGAASLEGTGYVEEEFFVEGLAHSFEPVGELGDDGRWSLQEGGESPYVTRILVKRPTDPADFSGVVVVEWNNVSAGFDATPDWTFASVEIIRSGHVHVAVSAQKAGVDAEPGSGLVGGASLVEADPDRYGQLAHPGDEYSYDVFAQVGALVQNPPETGPSPLGVLRPERAVAIGESQSAFRLTSFVNGVHPLRPVFDGYFVHSRGGGHAPVESADGSVGTSGATLIRGDLEVPVLVLSTETDLTLLGYAAARQPDTDLFRSWEVAGTAHADTAVLGGADPVAAGEALGCSAPVNDGPQHLTVKSGLAHLIRWSGDPSAAPPSGELIELDVDGAIVRDDDGNAVGGIRLPHVEVPVATLSGDPVGESILCGLFGSTTPFPPEDLRARYGDLDRYLTRFETALEQVVDDGFVLAADVETELEAARAVDFG